jgi:hypothetical protein
MNVAKHIGGCLCGSVRYAATGEVKDLCVCHCASCRRATGGLMVPWGTVSPERFAVTRGQLTEFRSSSEVVRGFCASCGTTLTYRHAQRPGEIDFALTTLDDPNQLVPEVHIWTQDGKSPVGPVLRAAPPP